MKIKPKIEKNNKTKENICLPLQNCPQCDSKISALPGTRDAICQNCGYKDPCCE